MCLEHVECHNDIEPFASYLVPQRNRVISRAPRKLLLCYVKAA